MADAAPKRAAEVLREYADMIYDSELNRSGPLNGRCDPQIEEEVAEYRALADALSARSESAPIPAGWKLVPIEPTEAMLEALGSSPWIVECDTKTVGHQVITTRREHREQRYVIDGWNAMLAAAPEAP